jgi:hypothetical protein
MSKAVAEAAQSGTWRRVTAVPELKVFGSDKRLINLCRSGAIKAKRVHRTWFVHETELRRFLDPECVNS